MLVKHLLPLAAAVSSVLAHPVFLAPVFPSSVAYHQAAAVDPTTSTTTTTVAAPTTTTSDASQPSSDSAQTTAEASTTTAASNPTTISSQTVASAGPAAPDSGKPKAVVAHFIVGNAQNYAASDWTSDIELAKQAHLDGFVLNIASQDTNTNSLLQAAYDAAASAGDFKMFLSFDYLSEGAWDAGAVTNLINTYKSHEAQFLYNDQPLVSTFEGVNNAGDWAGIKASTGCFFIPSWTSMGPSFADHLSEVDGAFSWDLWPVGAEDKDTSTDQMWIDMLNGKPYMMGVAPWFYTNLPQWSKNWCWRGDDLWYQRWQQIIEIQPALVEVVTWNDYGESHYIGPIHSTGVPSGADYVNEMPHDSWRTLLPYYIDAYKSGTSINPSGDAEKITYWYRKNPSSSGGTGGTTGNNPAEGQTALPPGEVSQDKVFVSVLVQEASQVTVQIGSGAVTTLEADSAGVNHFSVPFDGQTGTVSFAIVRSGQTIVSTQGPAITTDCEDGNVNWNAIVGESS